MAKELQLRQNTPEWLSFRKGKIGASEIPIILGVSPYKTPYQLWLEKTSKIDGFKKTANMQYGNDQEVKVREMLQNSFDVKLRDVVFQNDSYEWAIASIDAFGSTGTFPYYLMYEIKCANKEDHQMALDGKIPEKYVSQLQWQLFVTGYDKTNYVSFHKNDYVIVPVKRDYDIIRESLKKAEEFIQFVREKKPPPMVDGDLHFLEETYLDGLISEYKKANDERMYLDAKSKDLKEKEDRIKEEIFAKGSFQTLNAKCFIRKRKGLIDYKKIFSELCIEENILDSYRAPDVEIKVIEFKEM